MPLSNAAQEGHIELGIDFVALEIGCKDPIVI